MHLGQKSTDVQRNAAADKTESFTAYSRSSLGRTITGGFYSHESISSVLTWDTAIIL